MTGAVVHKIFCGRCGLALFEKRHLVEGVITGFFKAVRFFFWLLVAFKSSPVRLFRFRVCDVKVLHYDVIRLRILLFKLTHSSRSWGIVDVREVPALIANVASSVVYSACDGRFLLLLCARCVLLFGMGYPSSTPCLFSARCELLRRMCKPQDKLQCNCLHQFGLPLFSLIHKCKSETNKRATCRFSDQMLPCIGASEGGALVVTCRRQ